MSVKRKIVSREYVSSDSEEELTNLLHLAIKNDDISKVEELLAEGADINKVENGDTPLILAVKQGSENIVKVICSKGAAMDIKGNNSGLNALHISALRGNYNILKVLLDFGTNIHLTSDNGDNALHYASANGHKEIVEQIVELIDINAQNDDGNTPLHLAAISDDGDMTELLLEHGANCRIKNEMFRTPFSEAKQRKKGITYDRMKRKGYDLLMEQFLQTGHYEYSYDQSKCKDLGGKFEAK